MNPDHRTPHSAPHRIRLGRLGAGALLAIVLAGAAASLGPFASSAQPQPATPALVRPDGPTFLGRTVGRDHCLLAYASPGGVVYTVTTPGGRTLRADLTAEEVYRFYPDLDPASLNTGALSGPLMMVTED